MLEPQTADLLYTLLNAYENFFDDVYATFLDLL